MRNKMIGGWDQWKLSFSPVQNLATHAQPNFAPAQQQQCWSHMVTLGTFPFPVQQFPNRAGWVKKYRTIPHYSWILKRISSLLGLNAHFLHYTWKIFFHKSSYIFSALFSEKTNYFSLFPNGLAKPIKYPKQVLFNFLKGSTQRGRGGGGLKCVIERKCNKGGGVSDDNGVVWTFLTFFYVARILGQIFGL